MSTMITGVVTNGVIVPTSPLPEGAHVEIQLQQERQDLPAHRTPEELRRLPRNERQKILAAAAALAEADYRDDKDLTGAP